MVRLPMTRCTGRDEYIPVTVAPCKDIENILKYIYIVVMITEAWYQTCGSGDDIAPGRYRVRIRLMFCCRGIWAYRYYTHNLLMGTHEQLFTRTRRLTLDPFGET